MARRPTLSPLLAALMTTVALTACGGGGDSDADSGTPPPAPAPAPPPPAPPPAPATTITGTAAAGAPVIGQVTVRDSLGAQKTVTIAADGGYTVDVSGMTGPFQFRAVGKVGGRDVALSSVATADDIGKTINITPFTDLIVANVVGRAVDGFLSNDDFAHLTTAELNAARDTLTQRLLPILQQFGVADSFDLLRSAFTANRTQFDAVMDVVRVSVDPETNQAVIRDLINNQQIVDDLASKADTTAIPAPTDGSLTGAVTDLQQVDALFAAMTALFKDEQPAEDNAQLLAMLHPDFLDNGLSLEEFLTPDNMPEAGGKLHNAAIVKRENNGDLLVSFEYVSPQDGAESVQWYFRKDDQGQWRALGNGRLLDVSVAPINHRFTHNGMTTYSRHLDLWVDSAVASVQRVRVTGPGITDAIMFVRSTDDPDANFSMVGNNGGSWIPECSQTVVHPCIDFSKVGNNVNYTVTTLNASGQPVGAQVTLELQRPPVSNADAEANASKWFASYTIAPQSYALLGSGVNVVYTWTPPSEAGYIVQSLGLSDANHWLSGDPEAGATSGVVGTWEGPAPTLAPNTWIHVKGPLGRRFVAGQMFPQ